MLQLLETRLDRTLTEAVLPSITIDEEGFPLSYEKDTDGLTKVRLCDSADAVSIFAGFSYSRNSAPATYPAYLTTTIPTGLYIDLDRTPISGQILVKVDGVAVDVVTGSPADATEVKLAGRRLTFYSGEAGKAVTVQLRYNPTVEEARLIVGQAPIGGLASSNMGQIGVIKRGLIGTNAFDASADWSSALYVKPGNGVLTVATANERIPGLLVKNSPNAASPFLILSVNLP
jgi:hypothetical protein